MAALCEELEQLARSTALVGTRRVVTALEEEFTRVRDALHVEQGRVA